MEQNEPVLRVNVIDTNPDLQSVRAMVITESWVIPSRAPAAIGHPEWAGLEGGSLG